MNHFVQKQVFDIHVASRKEAKVWQEKISVAIKETTFPRLEKVFDELCDDGETIRIDKLELDLGKISSDKFVQTLDELAALKFREAVARQYADRLQISSEIDPENGKQLAGVTELSDTTTHSDLEACIHYIRYGTLPWWFAKNRASIREVWNRLLAGRLSSDDPFLRKEIDSVKQSERLFSIIKRQNRWELLAQLIDLKYEFKQIKQIAGNAMEDLQISELSSIVNSWRISVRSKHETEALVLSITVHFILKKQTSTQLREKLLDFISDYLFRKSFPLDLSQTILSMLQKKEAVLSLQSMLNSSESVETILDEFAEQEENTVSQNDETAKGKNLKIVRKDSAQDQDSMLVPNAGVVILWPYLQMFFKELGYLDGSEFTSELMQSKAVQILHFLSSNQQSGDEWEWPLLKVMCGLEIQKYVEDQFEISERERAESENLLRSVIKNWPVLKNTSPTNLQASFLLREGLLKKEEHGWVVQIERTGIDVLLDKINWPISVIRLPWNDYMIHVKW